MPTDTFSATARHWPQWLTLLAAVLLLPLVLQGCWTLETYVARIRIEPDGSYKYFLEGTAVHTATAHALRRVAYDLQTGKAKAEDAQTLKAGAEAGLQKALDEARKDPRVQEIKPIGDGRVRFVAAGRGSIAGGELIYSARTAPFAYARGAEGTLSVRLKEAVVGRDAEAQKLKVEGDVSVILAPGITVLEHNAEKTPSAPGGAYHWRVENPGQPAPHLVLRLPAQAGCQGAGPAPGPAVKPASGH